MARRTISPDAESDRIRELLADQSFLEWVRRSRESQGCPRYVEDPRIIAGIERAIIDALPPIDAVTE